MNKKHQLIKREVLKRNKIFKCSSITKFGSDDEVVIRITGSSSDLTNDIGDEMHKILDATGKFEIRRVDMIWTKSWWRT